MEKIIIENFGPVSRFEAEVKDVMIFIGPQASGKSTISKLIFFFKSVKDVILGVIWDFDVQLKSQAPIDLIAIFNNYLSAKFLAFFGNASNRSPFKIEYYYSKDKFIEIVLPKTGDFLQFTCSEIIKTELNKIFVEIKSYKQNFSNNKSSYYIKKTIEKHINSLFENQETSIFIPGGRSLISILNKQVTKLNLESDSLDFFSKTFIKNFLSIKSFFKESLESQVKAKKEFHKADKSFEQAEMAVEIIKNILKGGYQQIDIKDERLYFNDQDYIKLNYASSGQQEALWILLIIFKFILDGKNVFIVVEEPEAHLYPESQNEMVKLMALLANINNNQIIITTHSPYILSAFNNLLYAHKIGKDKPDEAAKLINPQLWLDVNRTSAYFIDGDSYESIIDPELKLIQAEKIDSAARIINETFAQLFDLDD